MDVKRALQPLSPDLQSLLRTGVALTSMVQCMEELVLNSIDAGATCIAVRVDMSRFKVQVFDNGHGIQKNDLETVAERYYTSKCHTVSDLDNLCYFGYRGEAVASLREISAVLEIVSRTKVSQVSYCKLFQNGSPLPVIESTVPRPSVGTTITAHDLFYNLPVRQKHINQNLELEKIRQKLEAIALVQSSISLSLRNDCTGQVILQTRKTNSLLNTFTRLFGAAKSRCLCELKAENEYFKIHAYFGKEGSSRKDHQFVYVNKRVVLKTDVSKLVSNLMGKSLIVKTKTPYAKALLEDSPTKHVDRYPIFVILIECGLTEYDITFEPAKTLVQFKHWESLRESIEKLVQSFLVKENLNLAKDPVSPKDNSSEKEVFEESPDISLVDTSDIDRDIHTNKIHAGMSSKLVRRKKDFYHEENIGINSNSSSMDTHEDNDDASISFTNHKGDSVEEDVEASQAVSLQTNTQGCSGVENSIVDVEEGKCLVTSEIENGDKYEKAEAQCDKNGQNGVVVNFKTPSNINAERKDPPRIHPRKVPESQLEDDLEDNSQDFDEEDPFQFKMTDSVAEGEVPDTNTRKNYICISTPHISPGGNSTLSAFRKSLLSSRNGGSGRIEKMSLTEKLRQRKSKEKSSARKPHEKNVRHSSVTGISDHVPEKNCSSRTRTSLSSFRKYLPQNQSSTVHDTSVSDPTKDTSCINHQHTGDKHTETVHINISKNDNKKAQYQENARQRHCLGSSVEKQESSWENQKSAISTACHCYDSDMEKCETHANGNMLYSTTGKSLCSNNVDLCGDGSAINPSQRMVEDVHMLIPISQSDLIFSGNETTGGLDVHTRTSGGLDVHTRKRLNTDMAKTTASKMSRMIQNSVVFDSVKCANNGISLDRLDSSQPKDKCFSMYSDLEDLTIPVSLQKGFQLKNDGGPSAEKEHSKSGEEGKLVSTSCLSQIIPDSCETQTEKERDFEHASKNCKPRNEFEDFEIWPPRNNLLKSSHNQGVSDEKKEESFSQLQSNSNIHLKDPFIMDINDYQERIQNSSEKASKDSHCLFDVTHKTENAPVKNMLDLECNLFCDETLADLETSTRRVKDNRELTQHEPEMEHFWHFDDSQEFIPTNLTFDSDFSKEIQEPSRRKLNLSLVDSIGFSFSSVSGNRSGENTPNTPNSELTIPKFEQRTCCSPTGSEGFSPNLNPDEELISTESTSSRDYPKTEDEGIEQKHIHSESQESFTLSRVLGEETEKTENCDESQCSFESEEFSKWFSLGSNCSSCEENSRAQSDDFVSVPNASLSQTQCVENSSLLQQQNVNENCDTDLQEKDNVTRQSEYSVTVNNNEKNLESKDEEKSNDKSGENLSSAAHGSLCPSECVDTSPWSEVADGDLLNIDLGNEKLTGAELQKTWIKITDQKTGKDIFVNQNTGNTVTDENLIPDEDKQDDRSEETEQASQCRRPVKKVTASSPSTASSIRTMIEEHFDADDEMLSIKWKDKGLMESFKGRSVADLFKEWENPVFPRPDLEVLNAETQKERTYGASKAQRSLNPCTFTKDMLKDVEVLGQMDNKFIICVLKTENQFKGSGLLVVFDQHAAHERVRLEQLTKDCYESDEGRQFKSCLLSSEEELKLTEEDVRVMEAFRGEFQRIGICFSKSKLSRHSVLIKEIPSCITKKEEKQREGIVILNILKNTITEHVQFLKSTKGAKDHMPLTIHKLLCGLACRGAIKFGDPLSKEECMNLLVSLAQCHLPFQCAHGRPSVMPLISTDKLINKYTPRKPNLWKIAKKVQHK
ncbi:DNA mismatch repair protein Mlh3-like [Saccostrea echinata]|uniref:DNA mismatch repair protein Mlh3-like n=1 Tax=Saccostrea echinata TaxID=191078 RepID=UPI002A80C9F6|nr:DNA mismatch repair protein Mlh3-like [Saccostrea echinata]